VDLLDGGIEGHVELFPPPIHLCFSTENDMWAQHDVISSRMEKYLPPSPSMHLSRLPLSHLSSPSQSNHGGRRGARRLLRRAAPPAAPGSLVEIHAPRVPGVPRHRPIRPRRLADRLRHPRQQQHGRRRRRWRWPGRQQQSSSNNNRQPAPRVNGQKPLPAPAPALEATPTPTPAELDLVPVSNLPRPLSISDLSPA